MRTLLLLLIAGVSVFANTIVQQTVINPDGSLASGIVHIKATAACASGSNFLRTAVITVRFTAGAFSVSLVPNDTCIPAGTAYAVTWQVSGAQATNEYWVVPTSGSPVSVASVRSALPPSPALLFSPTQLSQASATVGQCLIWSGTAWGPEACAAANAVSSIFGRVGAVTAQSGDYTTSLVTEGSRLYFTAARARATISASSPLAYNSTTGVLTCPTCGTGSVSSVFGRSGAVTAQSGDYTTSLVTEGSNLYHTTSRVRAAVSATSPISYNSSTGVISCPTCGTSTGNMQAATYDPANYASQVEVIAHKNMASGYPGLDGSSKLSIALIPTGITGSTVPFGNDARFSDARTPTAHASTHQNSGGDEVATATPAAYAIPKAGSGGKLAAGWIPAPAALAANGTNCNSGEAARGVDASGNAEGCTSITGSTAGLRPITFTFDGGGSAIASGATAYARMPVACTIVDWSISSSTAETVTVKTWKIATGTAIPTVANSISTSGVSLSSGTHVRSTTVSDFTSVAVTANDVLAANLTAITASQWVQFTLSCQQ